MTSVLSSRAGFSWNPLRPLCQGLPTEQSLTEHQLCTGGELSKEDPQGNGGLVENTELGKIGTAL